MATVSAFGRFAESRLPRSDNVFQIRHLHRRERRLESLVAALEAGAVDGLLERVAGEDAESMGHAGFLGRLADAAGALVGDHVVVRGVAAEQAPKADDGVEAARG